MNILCKWIGPGWFLPGCTLAFGIASIATGLVRTPGQLFAVRFLVGAFESVVMPGMAYYLSRWYRRAELGFRLSFYIAMAPLAAAFGGLLASAILTIPSIGTLHGWRLIFFVEGVMTVGVSIVAFFLLTDRPETARWLTPEERRFVAHRVTSERLEGTILLDSMNRTKVWRGIANPITLATGFMMIMNSFTVQGLGNFLPTVVATIYPDAPVTRQQLYTVPPNIIGAVLVVALSGLSWVIDRRQIIMIFSALPVLTGYAIFLGTLNPHARYAATFLIASTVYTMGSMTNAQVSCNVVNDSARTAALATCVTVGAFGVSRVVGFFKPSPLVLFDLVTSHIDRDSSQHGPFYRLTGLTIRLPTASTWRHLARGV